MSLKNIPIELKNGYILIQDVKYEAVTQSGIYIPNEQYNRFARVMKSYEGSMLKEGDIVIKPINRDTPLKIDGVVYRAIKESLIFAKLIEDED